MLSRLAPQSENERLAVEAAGLDARRIYTCDELIAGDEIFFAATGITDGDVLRGVHFRKSGAATHSVVMRRRSGTIRFIHANHFFERKPRY